MTAESKVLNHIVAKSTHIFAEKREFKQINT